MDEYFSSDDLEEGFKLVDLNEKDFEHQEVKSRTQYFWQFLSG